MPDTGSFPSHTQRARLFYIPHSGSGQWQRKLSEGGFSDNAIWRPVKHFNYTYLRNAFQTALLNEMEQHIGPSFKKIKAYIYHKDKNGFYVYAKPNLCDPNTVIKYIGCYLGRPVIALKRIDSYDGENVTFHYNRHEDNAYVKRTIPAIEFIKIDTKLYRAIHKSKHRFIKSFTKWRQDILLSFGYDPLFCPHCKKEMALVEVYYRHKQVSLQELYERTMAKVKCRSA